MGSFGGGNPIIWDIILQNLFILLVYQRVFTFTRLSPSYYYFLGRIVSPGQLILCINTGRCCVARFKPEKERERLVPFIIQFITGSPAPAQVIQNELFGFVFFFRGDFAVQQLCKVPGCTASLRAQALGLQAALQQQLPKGEQERALSAPWKANPTAAAPLPRLRREGLAASQPRG